MITKEQAIEILKGDFSKVILSENESHSELFTEAFNMAIEALNGKDTNVPSEWIPCSERLPEETGEYLLQTETGDMFNGNFDENIGGFGTWKSYYENLGFTGAEWIEFADVIAWMPLPAPYIESED